MNLRRLSAACLLLTTACHDGTAGDPAGDTDGATHGKADSATAGAGPDDPDPEPDLTEGCTDHDAASSTTDDSSGDAGGEDTGDDSVGSSSGGEDSGDGEDPPGVDCQDFGVWVEGGGGYSTVQGGVDGAPAGGTVYVCPGHYTEAVTIRRSVTIVGAGRDLVSIDGGDAVAVMDIDPVQGVEVAIAGVTLLGGRVGLRADTLISLSLAGMRVEGATEHGLDVFCGASSVVEANDLIVRGIDSAQPGAGLNLSNGTTTLTDCVFEDNASEHRGGAMYLYDADVTVVGGHFRRNRAVIGGGGAYLHQSQYGPGASLTITESDWGTGELQENEDEDVLCSAANIGDSVSTWLGSNVSASCGMSYGNGGDFTCCE